MFERGMGSINNFLDGENGISGIYFEFMGRVRN